MSHRPARCRGACLAWRVALLSLSLTAPVWCQPARAIPGRPAEALLFEGVPRVETAALYTQTLQEAPARVTVVTAGDIRRYGYRTLADVLSHATGFYLTQDGVDSFIGVRGFSLLGDYNTRILVMLNGHCLSDNIYGAMYMFGESFGVDMDLVERIEVVRGPTSSLYGSNGVFATVNIFTRAPVDSPRGYVSAEYGHSGTKKAIASGSAYLGGGANLLVAASGVSASGRSAFVENLIDSGAGGWARKLDSAGGYHTFAQLTWKDWSVTGNWGAVRATHDGGWFGGVVGDPGTYNRDAHNFVEAAWRRAVGSAAEFSWRFSYDQFRFDGGYAYQSEDGRALPAADIGRGDWLGTRLAFRMPVRDLGNLIVGAEGRADLRTLQEYRDASSPGPAIHAARRNAAFGVFAQQEVVLSPQWSFFFGLRGDDSRFYRHSVTPRAGVVYKRSAATTIKYLYGKSFRDPSAYERFYVDSPGLAPERARTYEVVLERGFGDRVQLAASAYHYSLRGLIEAWTDEAGFAQFRNASSRSAHGLELEGRANPGGGIEIVSGLAIQPARAGAGARDLPNSPRALASIRGSVPLWGGRVSLSPAARYIGRRVGGFAAGVPARAIVDLTASTSRLHRQFDVVLGVRNLGGRPHNEPMSEEHLGYIYALAGRTAFVKLIWHAGD